MPMNDSKIIELFFERSEKAIFELSNKYGTICMRVAYNILENAEDSEECVNDSYLGVWNAIPPEKPNPLLAFVLKIVRNLSLNRVRYNSRQKRNSNLNECLNELEWHLPSVQNVDEEIDVKLTASYINDFLSTLDESNQMLFVRRYWYMDSYKDLAKQSGLKEGTIRARLSRTRESLRNFLNEKGVIV